MQNAYFVTLCDFYKVEKSLFFLNFALTLLERISFIFIHF